MLWQYCLNISNNNAFTLHFNYIASTFCESNMKAVLLKCNVKIMWQCCHTISIAVTFLKVLKVNEIASFKLLCYIIKMLL